MPNIAVKLIYMHRTILLFICVVLAGEIHAQDTVWLSERNRILPKRDSAVRYNLVYKDRNDTTLLKVVSYAINGVILSERSYQVSGKYLYRTSHGPYRTYENGKLREEGEFNQGTRTGQLKTYWENGQLKRNDGYKNGEVITRSCYDRNGMDTTWFEYDIPAGFPGGTDSLRKYITRHLYYPSVARNEGIQGTVEVSFTVTQHGKLTDIAIRKSRHPLLDNEALRVIRQMPDWLPGKIDGNPAAGRLALPVVFRMNDE